VSQAEAQSPGTFAERFVEADGFRIRYLEAGAGPPLVMLHSAGGQAVSRAHELLVAPSRPGAPGFRVLAFEVPGFGASPANERSRSMGDLARTMLAAIDGIGLGEFALAGTSFGGRLAAWLALAAGERVQALVLIAPQTDAALDQRLAELAVPTLVVVGARDDDGAALGRRYRATIPNCNLVFVYDAGREIGAQRPEALAGVVGDFLERHETFVVSRTTTLINP
jgi:pimeloyl-ACP methyl ester carboxylesterase